VLKAFCNSILCCRINLTFPFASSYRFSLYTMMSLLPMSFIRFFNNSDERDFRQAVKKKFRQAYRSN
jgi:hypothetical protein